jgi:hypothetical protein
MSTLLFANQAQIVVYYTVMGYQFDQDESYNLALNEVLGASTIVYDAPPLTSETTPTDMSVVNRLSREQTNHHCPSLQQQICNFQMRRETLVLQVMMMMTTLMMKTKLRICQEIWQVH